MLLSSLQARQCPQPHRPAPPPPSEFNRNLPVTRPKYSLLGEQNRGRWEGGWRLNQILQHALFVIDNLNVDHPEPLQCFVIGARNDKI